MVLAIVITIINYDHKTFIVLATGLAVAKSHCQIGRVNAPFCVDNKDFRQFLKKLDFLTFSKDLAKI